MVMVAGLVMRGLDPVPNILLRHSGAMRSIEPGNIEIPDSVLRTGPE
jgi:hypothetical protein